MTTDPRQTQIHQALAKLAQTGTRHHATGDLAAKVALTAPDRRLQRNAQNVNRTCRAVGEGVNASLWLFGVVTKGVANRRAPADAALPAFARMLADAAVLVDDLEFEAKDRHRATGRRRRSGHPETDVIGWFHHLYWRWRAERSLRRLIDALERRR